MYEIRAAGIKGLGVFAKNLIPRGTRIFSERPLLGIRHDQDAGDIFTTSGLLSPNDRRKLMELSSHVTKELSILRWTQAIRYTVMQTASAILTRLRGKGDDVFKPMPNFRLRDHVTTISIFRSNSFNLGSSSPFEYALFPQIARINHSCVPNAQGNFHNGLGTFNVHATRDISPDEEISLSYLPEQSSVRDSRQRKLMNGYGFECGCPACDLSLARGKIGEDARIEMQRVLGDYAESIGNGGLQSPKKELEMILTFIKLLESDGIAGRELSTLYFEAAKLNRKLERYQDGLKCAERGLEIDEDCLGTDHALYQNSLKEVEALRRFNVANV